MQSYLLFKSTKFVGPLRAKGKINRELVWYLAVDRVFIFKFFFVKFNRFALFLFENRRKILNNKASIVVGAVGVPRSFRPSVQSLGLSFMFHSIFGNRKSPGNSGNAHRCRWE